MSFFHNKISVLLAVVTGKASECFHLGRLAYYEDHKHDWNINLSEMWKSQTLPPGYSGVLLWAPGIYDQRWLETLNLGGSTPTCWICRQFTTAHVLSFSTASLDELIRDEKEAPILQKKTFSPMERKAENEANSAFHSQDPYIYVT